MNNTYSLYIHIPYCISKCKYCDFFSKPCNKGVPSDYVQALKNEIKWRLCGVESAEVKSIYIGGGTPSLLSKIQLSEILDTVKMNSELKKDCEITIEVNPDDVTEEFLKNISNLGINRLSVGIQSMNDKVLKYSGRRANVECNLKALECIKNNWNGIFSVDLICAMPFETSKTFVEGIKTVCKYEPEHISLYSLTIEAETPFGKMYENNDFNYDWDKADLMWIEGRKKLIENGYAQYEVSNFCKTGYECKHNLSYWNHENYIGTGSGGTGTVYPDRWTNTNDLSCYISFWNNLNKKKIEKEEIPQVNEKIEKQTSEFEFFMMGLRKLSGIKESDYKSFFGKKMPESIVTQFERWQKKKLAVIETLEKERFYRLNDEGILFLNRFLEELEI